MQSQGEVGGRLLKIQNIVYTRPDHAGAIESIRCQSIIKLVNFNQLNFNSKFLEVKFNQSISFRIF